MRWLTTAFPGLLLVAPVALKPERLRHPAPWLLFGCLWAVHATQPAPRGQLFRDVTDRRSALLILVSTAVACEVAVAHFTARAALRPPALSALTVAGTALALGGVALRVWAIYVLGPRFTALVEAPDQLVEAGPYARLRHPSYLGVLVALAGMSLVFGSAWAAAAVVVLVVPAYLYRVRLEEAVLSKALGERYVAYRRRTGALLPRSRHLRPS